MKEFHSGEKLKLAIKLKGLRIQDVADAFQIEYATVQQWQYRGVPKSKIPTIATYFEVEDWVFSDGYPFKEDLKRIISDQSFQDKLRPNGIEASLLSKLEEVDSEIFDTRKELEKAVNNYYQKIKTNDKFKLFERLYISLEIMESPELSGSIVGKSFDLNGDWSGYKDLLEEKDDEEIISHQPRHFSNIEDLVAQESQFVLLGEAGSGKTTSLEWLFFNAIQKYQPEGKVFLFISLVQYQRGEDLITSICNESGLTLKYVDFLLKTKRITLLLDAHNECQIQAQKACARQIQLFHIKWPDIPIVLTTRTHSWSRNLELPVFTIQPLTHKQQSNFLETHLKDKNRADIVLNQLHDQPGGELIANNPWLLFMIARVTRDGKDLPKGRAQIYRQYIQQWYEREIRKAKRAYSILPWNKDQIFLKLAHLAAHMRLNGYVKEAPISWIAETMGNEWISNEKLFHLIGQGLILTVENDNLSFFHETLQEYLVAEHILQHPDFLEEISQDRMEAWHVIWAYVFELNKRPSPELIKVAWRLSPLLVALVIDDIQILQDLPIPNINPFLKNTLYLLIKPERSNITYLKNYEKISLKSDGSILRSSAVEYLLQIDSTVQKKMRLLKSHWVKYPLPILFDLGYMRLLQRNDFPEEKIEQILKFVAQKNPEYVNVLITLQWAAPEDFRRILPSMIGNARPENAYHLIKNGIATPDEFQKKLPSMIRYASPKDAYYLIKANLAVKEDFSDLLILWFNGSKIKRKGEKYSKKNKNYSHQVVEFDLITKDYIDYWIENAGALDACWLVKKGYANIEDFDHLIAGWIKQVAPRRARLMLDVGLADKSDFIPRIKEWKEKAKKDIGLRSQLIKYDFASKEDFQ